ncbi:MAG: serine hydrolase [Cyclobacteriaceae bacterium]
MISYRITFAAIALLISFASYSQKRSKSSTPSIYYPDKEWAKKEPSEVGMDAAKLKEAVDFAIANDASAPRDLKLNHYRSFGREPFGDAIGPIKTRGEQTGVIIKNGYVIAEWGEPWRIDMTHSVTKSFLSSVVGLAYDKGMIKNIDDPAYQYVPPIWVYDPLPTAYKADEYDQSDLLMLFDTPHNQKITWRHLLQQNSDWEGTLWGKPDWADRPSQEYNEWGKKRNEPGTVYEYNDTRVNVLALAALSVWRKPLPDVLKENIMDPIGASNMWRWYGYENSYIVLDGKIVQSVSGGGHWGGGMFIHAYDMARFGYLTLRNGNWNGKQLLSEQWNKWAQTPSTPQPTYGFMNWFLNTGKEFLPSAPEVAFAHIGNGTNMVYVDQENDIVAVVRYLENSQLDEFVKRMLAAQR